MQAIKAGVLEIADMFAVNKADREGADHTVMALQMMQGLGPAPSQGHHRPAEGAPARQRKRRAGLAAGGRLAPADREDGGYPGRRGGRTAQVGSSSTASTWPRAGSGTSARMHALRSTLEHILRDRLLERLLSRLPDGRLEEAHAAIATRRQDPYSAAEELLTTPGSD